MTDTQPTLTIPVAALRRLLLPVLPMAAADNDLPVLSAVLIETSGDQVFAWTTDRFQLGCSRLPLDDTVTASGEFRALLPVSEAKHLLGLFKPQRGHADAAVRLTVDDLVMHAESAGGLFDFATVRVGYRLLDGKYPDVRRLLVERLSETGQPQSGVVLNPTFLAKFGAAGASVAVDLSSKPNGGTLLVRVGDSFVGLLMPLRFAEAKSPGEWLAQLTTQPERQSA